MNDSTHQTSSPCLAGRIAALNYLEDVRRETEVKRQAKELGLAKFAQLPEGRKREAEARYEILAAMRTFITAGGFKKDRGLRIFREQYNAGKIELPDWVRDALKGCRKLDRATLHRWRSRYGEQGLSGLAGSYGHREGFTRLSEEQRDFIKAMIADHPDVLIPKIMAGLEARFIPQGSAVPASHVVSRFVRKYREENASLLLAMKNPDAWRSKYQFAVGSCSGSIVRLNQLWEADATPGDIMLLDGRHAVIAQIDIWPRRPKILVTPTSKAQAIATLLRRGLIDWGVPEVYRTDNGKDFTARHMERVLDALEIEHDICPPFTPEAKPHVERFIKTFSHGIVELLPGFIGHNVSQRKAIEARRSFSERLMKKGAIVEVKLSAHEFQAICNRWIEAVYMQTPHEGLDGMTPAQKVRSWTDPVKKIEDERALDVLLCPAPKDGGLRMIGKKGVEANRRCYFNTAMAGYEGKRVRVLIDYADLGRAYCFEETGEFLCIATCPDWYGISAEDEAGCLKRAQRRLVSEKRKELKRLAREHRIGLVPEEVLDYRESLIANVDELPQKTEAYTTAAIEEAIAAADKSYGIVNREALAGPLEVPPEVLAYEEGQKKLIDLQEKRRQRRLFESNQDVYFWVLSRITDGTDTEIQRQWKREYEAWQDSGMKRPFSTSIGVSALVGEEKAMDEEAL
jgi:transposase InsO family protein